MKKLFNVWVFLGTLVTLAVSQSSYEPEHLTQDTYYDSDEAPYPPSSRRHYRSRSYEPESHDDAISNDPRHYQSLEPRYHSQEPESYADRPRYHPTPQHEPEPYPRQQSPQYHHTPQHAQYHQPEDPSYHRPQEIAYHQAPQHYQEHPPPHEEPYQGSSHYPEPETKEEDSDYRDEEPTYTQIPRRSPSSHPRPVPTDPKLPLYFTMYEKRVVQDPLDKYGKGPWRYLTYGHGITYGSKEPGKVFEKGYGYIRALGRDHCKLPEHLCPPRDEKPFDYEGRKEPYFGYRPH